MDLIALTFAQEPITLSLEILREYGPFVGGGLITIFVLGVAVRMLFIRLEKSYEREVANLKLAQSEAMKALQEGCANQIRLVEQSRDREVARYEAELGRSLENGKIWQAQAERFANRYEEVAQVTADLSDRLVGQHQKRPTR